MFEMEISGDKAMEELLEVIVPREAENLMRATVHGVAGEVRDAAKDEAPKKDGVLKKAIKTKRRRMRFGRISSDVIVTRRAFYWRFLEYGKKGLTERAFFLRAVRKIEARLPQILRQQFVKKLEARIARAKKRAAK